MFSPGDLVKAKTLYGEYFGVVVRWEASQSGKDLWRVMIDGELSHYYFLESQLTIVSKVNA
jgi:hypothetical protein